MQAAPHASVLHAAFHGMQLPLRQYLEANRDRIDEVINDLAQLCEKVRHRVSTHCAIPSK